MTREEHLEWCKKRAREYLDEGDSMQAVTSMLSDLSKHEETRRIGKNLGMLGMFACTSMREARRFIEGFR